MSGADDTDTGSSVKLQDPDETVKPEVNAEHVPDLIWSLYGLEAMNIKSLPSYDDLNFFFRAKPDTCENPNITRINEHGYVLKIMNSLQSSFPEIVDAQTALCDHVRARGIPTQCAVLNKNGQLYTLEALSAESDKKCLVRLVTFVPGNIFYETPYVPGSFYNVGKLVAKLHNAIADGFHHKFYDTYQMIWSLTEVTSLRKFYAAVNDENNLRVVKAAVDNFETNIVPKFDQFTKGIIHGDLNEQNIIVVEVPGQSDVPSNKRVHDVSALLDFSDVTKSYFVFDVAIVISYLTIECDDESQLDVGGHILAGYYVHRKLNSTELSCLKGLICCRLCQSLVFGAHSYAQQPGNEYLLVTSKRGWPLLHKIWTTDEKELLARWQFIIDSYKNK